MLLNQKIEPIVNEEEFNRRAEEIYRTKYQKKFEADKSLMGKIVAVEVETGDCFIGNTVLEAGFKGREKFPRKQFFFFRIGAKAVYSQKGVVFNI